MGKKLSKLSEIKLCKSYKKDSESPRHIEILLDIKSYPPIVLAVSAKMVTRHLKRN